ncbi:MAG: Gx transporter family protein [Gammaproteobacteria bacterium]|nr:Gx transporter family protein [Gammaproteobacteria bacterium]
MQNDTGLRTLTFTATREDYRIAWLAALAITIHIAESMLPSPLPGIKPGLANIVTIAALHLYGWRAAVWVSLLRVVVGGILIGTFLTPTFLLSFSGALAAVAVIGLGSLLPGRGLGPVGYCLLASMAHIAAQFYVAYRLFIPHEALFGLLPVLMTAGVGFGLASGFLVQAMMAHFNNDANPDTPAA